MGTSAERAPAPAALSWLDRFNTFAHALAFVAGFTTIFVIVFGLPLTLVGSVLGSYKAILALIGAVVVIVFGLTNMGVLNISWLNYDTRQHWGGRRDWGYLSSFLIGVFFAAGWSPCIGSTLGLILTMGFAQSNAQVMQGLGLLFAYSLGLGVPFLLVGLGVDRATRSLRHLQRHMALIKTVSGVFLILVGWLILVDALPATVLIFNEIFHKQYFISWPAWMPSLSMLANWALSNNLYYDPADAGGVQPNVFIAFIAGLFSFLSPCVLPLVPAYVGYLSGRAVRTAVQAG